AERAAAARIGAVGMLLLPQAGHNVPVAVVRSIYHRTHLCLARQLGRSAPSGTTALLLWGLASKRAERRTRSRSNQYWPTTPSVPTPYFRLRRKSILLASGK